MIIRDMLFSKIYFHTFLLLLNQTFFTAFQFHSVHVHCISNPVVFFTWQSYTEWRKKNACFLNLPAISFFGVTSNQKSTFENLVQSTVWNPCPRWDSNPHPSKPAAADPHLRPRGQWNQLFNMYSYEWNYPPPMHQFRRTTILILLYIGLFTFSFSESRL